MGLIFSYRYQHHDPHLLDPVERMLLERGHNVMRHGYRAFLDAGGEKALLLVGDHVTLGHVEGLAKVKLAALNNVPTVSMQHGAAAAFPNPGDPPMGVASDVRCSWGEFWHDWFSCDTFAPTGSPQHDAWLEYEPVERTHALLVPAFREDAQNKGLAGLDALERGELYLREAEAVGWERRWYIRPHPSDLKHIDRMQVYEWMVNELPGAELQDPTKAALDEVLPACGLVVGTSTVVLEGMVFGCQPYPVFMDYLPKNLTAEKEKLLGPLDGKATERVVATVEWMIAQRYHSYRSE